MGRCQYKKQIFFGGHGRKVLSPTPYSKTQFLEMSAKNVCFFIDASPNTVINKGAGNYERADD